MLPHIIQIMDDHDLILKPMVTWGSPILGPPSYSPLCAQTEAEPVELPKEEDNFSFFFGGNLGEPWAMVLSKQWNLRIKPIFYQEMVFFRFDNQKWWTVVV